MISVIIPAYNEEKQIGTAIGGLRENDLEGLVQEIIVADGGSSDNTVSVARAEGARIIPAPKGRAKQMNAAAAAATAPVLYFLHADSIPPRGFSTAVANAYRKGIASGCFRLAFDHDHWFLKANSWFTRFDVNAVRFGDQSLFATSAAFQKSGGFREDLLMMEDQEIIHRLKEQGPFQVMDAAVITSARKYLDNGVYRMQGIFYMIWLLYYLGCPQNYLLKLHRKLIYRHKL